jgi:hypothetical protein
MFERRHYQAEKSLVGFGRRQNLITHFRNKIQTNAGRVIVGKSELRLEQFAAIHLAKFYVLPLEILHVHLREPFQPAPEATLGPPRPASYAAQPPLIARKKTDDQVCFPVRDRVGGRMLRLPLTAPERC